MANDEGRPTVPVTIVSGPLSGEDLRAWRDPATSAKAATQAAGRAQRVEATGDAPGNG